MLLSFEMGFIRPLSRVPSDTWVFGRMHPIARRRSKGRRLIAWASNTKTIIHAIVESKSLKESEDRCVAAAQSLLCWASRLSLATRMHFAKSN